MTPAETTLWQRIRNNRLGGFQFRRQQIINRFIVDFNCNQVGLVVEIDGGIHATQQEYDQERQAYLESLRLRVIRFTNSEVEQQIDCVLDTIHKTCLDLKSMK